VLRFLKLVLFFLRTKGVESRMNIWNWILFYIYSGIAFGALITKRSTVLIPMVESEKLSDELQGSLRGRIADEAMILGSLMANGTTMAIVGGYNKDLIAQYEQAKAHDAAVLKAATPANIKGA
jgi:hypothetical protein